MFRLFTASEREARFKRVFDDASFLGSASYDASYALCSWFAPGLPSLLCHPSNLQSIHTSLKLDSTFQMQQSLPVVVHIGVVQDQALRPLEAQFCLAELVVGDWLLALRVAYNSEVVALRQRPLQHGAHGKCSQPPLQHGAHGKRRLASHDSSIHLREREEICKRAERASLGAAGEGDVCHRRGAS